jgi:hypothetical protein
MRCANARLDITAFAQKAARDLPALFLKHPSSRTSWSKRCNFHSRQFQMVDP